MFKAILGFLFKVIVTFIMTGIDAHMTVLKNLLPRDVVKPKILKTKTTKYFEGFN